MENEQLKQKLSEIKMYKVESSNIEYLGYNENLKILKVIFKNNSSYAYFGVPQFTWNQLCTCESKGKYLTENVTRRPDLYKYIKLR